VALDLTEQRISQLQAEEARMDIPALMIRIAEDPHLPTPPGLAFAVLEKASRADCELREIADMISLDSSLCCNLLRTVNSGLYGLPQKVTSIDRALVLLGYKAVRSLVLSLSLPTIQKQTQTTPKIRDYWKLSVAGAIVAREIAVKMRRSSPEDDLVAGLLRDVGIPILHQMAPEQYAAILGMPPEVLARQQCDLEEEKLGINHAEVAAFVLSKWHLPPEITEAVRFHHHPAKAEGQTELIQERARDLYFASLTAQLQLSASQPAVLCEVLQLARENYGMDEGDLLAFLDPLNQKVQEFASFLNVDIGSCEKYTKVVANATAELVKLTVEMSADNLRVREEKIQAERETAQVRAAMLSRDQRAADPKKTYALDSNTLYCVAGNSDWVTPSTPGTEPYKAPGLPDDVPAGFLSPPRHPGHLGLLGPFEVHSLLGRGGMGLVLKGHDNSLNRAVAIKVLAPQLAASSDARKRFAREARAAAAVRHEGVIAVYAVSEAMGLPYMVMEFVSGIALQDKVEEEGPLDFKLLFQVAIQIAEGLQAAHSSGLIHRDIKPANILLTNGVPKVKITDFGLARTVGDVSITQKGIVMGTPQYMAPEQACGQELDSRVDLFSLGSVLYMLATGIPPFDASSLIAVMRSVCEDTPRPIRELNPKIPKWFAEIVNRLHAKNPNDRFQHAVQVHGALVQHAKPLEPVSSPDILLPA
jgi:HD-like signal output (HDOD) protein